MLCQNCNQHQATTHIKRFIGGRAEEFHLCPNCARESGLLGDGPNLFGQSFPDFGFQLSDLFSGFLGSSVKQQPAALAPAARCGMCGASLQEIAKTGRVGCAKCYEAFYAQLEPTLQRIHSSLEHAGKTPEDGNPDLRLRREREQTLAALREQIAQAVKSEEYEEAARLRDEIRRLEEGGAEDELA